jgi:hypothetical protein
MRQILLMILAGCLLLAVGCEKASQSAVPKRPPGREPVPPIDWINNPPEIERVDLAKENFKTPELRATIERWEAATKKFCAVLAQEALQSKSTVPFTPWHQEPWYIKSPNLRDQHHLVVCWWSNAPQQVSIEGYLSGHTRHELNSPQELSGYTISFGTSNERPEAERVDLRVVRVPTMGWGTEFYCSSKGSGLEQINVIFVRHGSDAQPYSIDYFLSHMTEWRHHTERKEAPDLSKLKVESGTKIGDQLNFDLRVSLPLASAHAHPEQAVLFYQKLLTMRQSPDAFKQAAMQLLDALAEKIEVDFASGDVVKGASYRGEVGRGCHGLVPIIVTVEQSMTDEELQTCLANARSHVISKRAWIEQNYVGLHGALERVFPMEELIVSGKISMK